METHMIFETHAHYDDEAFEQDREALLNSMEAHGIGHIVNACASIESLKATEELMEKYPFVYGAFGIHPDDAEKMTEDTLNEIRCLCHLPKAVAIGEIGLDYYWHKEEREHDSEEAVSRTDGDCQRGKNAVYDPQQGCSQGYAGAGEGMHERGNVWRDYPLFFLWKGNGKGIPEYGTLSWNWRSCDV